MSNTNTHTRAAVAIRGRKSGSKTVTENNHGNAKYDDSSLSCAVAHNAACCMGEPIATATAKEDDHKYRKRLYQRRRKRIREGFLLLVLALCLLVYTVVTTRGLGTGGGIHRISQHVLHTNHNQNHHSNHDHEHDRDMTNRYRQQQRQRNDYGARGRGLGRGHDPSARNNGRGRKGNRNNGEVDWTPHRMEEEADRDDRIKRGRDNILHRNEEGDFHDYKREREQQHERQFEQQQKHEAVMAQLHADLRDLNERMDSNTNTTIRWANMKDVPPLPGKSQSNSNNNMIFDHEHDHNRRRRQQQERQNNKDGNERFFTVKRPAATKMAWELEFEALADPNPSARSNYVDYVHHTYRYPQKLMKPPALGEYPNMRTYKELMDTWPQDNLDNPPDVLQEDLMHFDWNNPSEMEAAVLFRTAKLPFKLIQVPELLAATEKWTDEYVSAQFDNHHHGLFDRTTSDLRNGPRSNGRCSEGPDNFFAFFNRPLWDVAELGIPPTRDNDWSYARWANHSVYADRVGLHPSLPHYYWQSGVPKEERHAWRTSWTFVSRDLPSFSSTKATMVQFVPEHQKGIQCRFGERGITAANHYDSGRNMIAMITGAKRYILSPPRACKKLGIVSHRGHSSFRHSMLNYGHMSHNTGHDNTGLDNTGHVNQNQNQNSIMPPDEKEWLEMAGSADAVSTVLKEGEVLYVPTGWFHYITSLQKSAQCNVRSGPDMSGDAFWGGAEDIQEECFPHP